MVERGVLGLLGLRVRWLDQPARVREMVRCLQAPSLDGAKARQVQATMRGIRLQVRTQPPGAFCRRLAARRSS